MKQKNLIMNIRSMMLTVLGTVLGFWAAAQDAPSANIKVSTTESTTSEMWYTSPWVWVVGAAVFILLLVALLNNRRGKAD